MSSSRALWHQWQVPRPESERLAISEGTVKIHLHHIYQTLKVENRLQLTLFAQCKKLV